VCVSPRNSSENGVFQGYKGYQTSGYQSSGHVSLFHPPTRHESGSYLQNYNSYSGYNLSGYQDYNYNYNLSNSGDHFKHTFSSIGPTGAEIRPVKGLNKNVSFGAKLLFLILTCNICNGVKDDKVVEVSLISCQTGLMGILTRS
jgi:hypothetical protein